MESVLKQHEDAQRARPIYVFDLPEEAVALNDGFVKTSVGLWKLTMREELRALDLASGSAAKAGYYMVMAALVEVDGRILSKADAEDERVLNGTDPMIRSLIVEAQTELSGSTKDATKKFLGSRRVKLG